MKKYLPYAALLAVPIAACVGFVAHANPAPPPLGEYLLTQENVKHVAGEDSDDWLAVALTGPNKGGSMDVAMALAIYPTHKLLEQSAQGKVAYYELKCQNYTPAGKKVGLTTAKVLRSCTSTKKTRKQVENYMRSLLSPPVKS